MSDMADQFFISWVGAFGKCDTKRLSCTWHVDKAWSKGLNTFVKSNKDKIDIHVRLKVLLIEIDKTFFHLATNTEDGCYETLEFLNSITYNLDIQN